MKKREKVLFLVAVALLMFGLVFVAGCANPQAVNFSKQIMKRAHCVDAIVDLKAKDSKNPQDDELTEIELRWILQSGFEAIGKTEKQACEKVEDLINPKKDDAKQED